VSHRQIHEFIVSHGEKHDKQCFLDQTTNEDCPTDKISLLKMKILYIVLWSILSLNKVQTQLIILYT
jgi:hypothetical protein